jgi:glycerophosphoryl diester phosphodiesterase
MVFHDAILDRTTDARRKWKQRRVKISQKTAAEIQTLDAGSWFDAKFTGEKVPLLSESLELICSSGGVALIERKSGDVKTLVKLLRELEMINKVVVISFDWGFLRELHELDPSLVLGALGPPARLSNGRKPLHVRRGLGSCLKDLSKTGARIAVWNLRVSKRDVHAAHKRGLKVWVYTIDEVRLARRLVKNGVNGIITNRVEPIREVVRASE